MFPELEDELTTYLRGQGYQSVKTLPDGRVIGVLPQFVTVGLFVGLDADGYSSRYCYEHSLHALVAAKTWDGVGDPPGPWVKHKGTHNGEGVDRLNPNFGK